ncbi:hypothetical protein AHAS_Ahas15G0229300 [Arachis hypogaea]
MVQKMPGSQVQIETRPPYNRSEEVASVRILHRVFWNFNPCIRAFKYCKPLVQVDGTYLYRKYKGCLLVAVAQDKIQNTVLIAFAIVEAVNRSRGDWKPLRAWCLFCIRHISSNFLREFKASYLQKLVVNIGYSRTVEEYNVNYKRLQERGEAYARWCDNIKLPQCMLAFDEGH